jgi:hypothetical protein
VGKEVGHGPPSSYYITFRIEQRSVTSSALDWAYRYIPRKASFFFTIESNCPNTDLSKGGDDQTKMGGRGFNLFHANNRNQKLATVIFTNAQRFPFAR